MDIELKLFFDFKKFLPVGTIKNTVILKLENGITVQKLIENLKLPPEVPKIIIVNGVTVAGNRKLKDGDSIAVFPPMAGG